MPTQPDRCPLCGGLLDGEFYNWCVGCNLPVAFWPRVAALIANQPTPAEQAVIEAAATYGKAYLTPTHLSRMTPEQGAAGKSMFQASLALARERRAADQQKDPA